MKKLFFPPLTLSSLTEEADAVWAYFRRLPTLETRDLLLRPMEMRDARDVYAWSSDPEVARYVLWEPHRNLSDTRGYLRWMRWQYRHGSPASWGIVLRSSGQVIGTIGFMWVSVENHTAEVGYSLGREHWNRGYMTQALAAVIQSAFPALALRRIEAQRDARNPASGRVLEKCGFEQEGVLRSRLFNKGEQIDLVMYSILRAQAES